MARRRLAGDSLGGNRARYRPGSLLCQVVVRLWGHPRRVLWLALVVLVAGVHPGCVDDDVDDGTKPRAVEDLPSLRLTDETANLLLTWIDDKGNTHTEVVLADIPQSARSLVRVVITDEPAGQGSRFYVADLSTKGADGAYAVHTMSRLQWESVIDKRRKAYIAKVAPPPPTSPPSSTAGGVAPPTAARGTVLAVVYGAAWCGPCHQAKAHLKKRGAHVIYKDIDRDSNARAEMASKLRRVGKAGAAIPVIDVGGQILVGFSPAALDVAMKRAQQGTAL